MAMSDYEKQFQATSKYYDSDIRKIEQNGGKDVSSVVHGSARRVCDWADVLRDLEPYY
jgi:hypothetical protein